MSRNNLIAFFLLLMLAIPFAASANRFYLQPADLEPGKTATLQFMLDNSMELYGFQAEVKLPEGLEPLKDEDDDLEITLSSRADAGEYMLNTNEIGERYIIMGAFSANHSPFTGNEGVLVNMNVSVASDFAGGTVEVSEVLFTNNENKDVEFDSTSAFFGVAVTGIELSASELSLIEGDTAVLTATITPASATDKTVTWSSSDESVATVSAEGTVTAVNVGTATITATTANGKTTTCAVTVETKVIIVTNVVLDKTELSLTEGESATLVATVAPADATDKSLTWTSSDATVATVDTDGKVTAVGIGEATITVTCGNVSATCIVNVLPILVESLTIDPTVISCEEGTEFKITATVAPANATDKTLSFESSDNSVASVDEEGNVKVLKAGNCVITVSTTDGSNLSAECILTGLSGVEAIFGEDTLVDVYYINGLLVKKGSNREELKQLVPGVYILRSGKAVVKTIVR